ncbi:MULTISPECIES: efflux RND transporter periplasmic adaptor subunit [unclassified Beijerinckia]|uniref:efflux RND transporter periplasmic adaptor subunit n=1 Tax=unclassified Beijerinckia TaxID=2638183 RepID=UPI0008948E03|nr:MULTISPECIES: efflux RND transporter periplasmic adaptor subunit [unclassified Beijerinckia]MDH7799531.1 cobalt-zinc-cadmium efflux system membrane fusion protein [Beijerinckia sp. GAS462]SEB46062.1 membrane fusion protein, cobalt-zinc-cadmium efflux system [Beijerinckia sp. 28-YEA-48]
MERSSKSHGRSGGAKMVVALAVFGVVACAGFVSWRGNGVPVASAAPSEPKDRDGLFRPTQAQWSVLSVEPVQAIAFRSEFSTEGKIAIDEDRATRVYSQYAGRVTQLAAGSGDKVQKGQLLFMIEAADSIETQKDFVSALGDLNKARSQVNLMTIAERRLGILYRDKAMALKDVEEAQANLTAAKNDVRTAEIAQQAVRNRLRLLGKTEAEITTFENTGIISPEAPVYSPIAGTVLQRNVGPGQYIDAGASNADPVLLVGDVSKVWLVAYVREADADHVKLNQRLTFKVLTLPGETFETRVSYVGSSLDSGSRRLLVRASVDNPHGRLKPEMFASARIAVHETAPSPAVARDAIIYEGDAARVWVARSDGAIELRRIKPGLANGDLIQVTSGITANEKVITRGSLFIDRAASLGS